jgi:hypothetical protein
VDNISLLQLMKQNVVMRFTVPVSAPTWPIASAEGWPLTPNIQLSGALIHAHTRQSNATSKNYFLYRNRVRYAATPKQSVTMMIIRNDSLCDGFAESIMQATIWLKDWRPLAASGGDGMSNRRPTLGYTCEPGLSYEATYFRVLQATEACRVLIHGKLENGHGRTCAIGAYFRQTNTPIHSRAIDEIVAYNDSFPKLSPEARWRKVRQWLKFETARLRQR